MNQSIEMEKRFKKLSNNVRKPFSNIHQNEGQKSSFENFDADFQDVLKIEFGVQM